MSARPWLAGCVLLSLAGCVQIPNLGVWQPEEVTTPLPSSSVGSSNLVVTRKPASYAAGSGEVSLRVGVVGDKIWAANSQLGVKPLFATLGSAQPESTEPTEAGTADAMPSVAEARSSCRRPSISCGSGRCPRGR